MVPDENLQLEGGGIADNLKKGLSSLLKKGISKAKKSGSKLLKKGISKAKAKATGRQLLNKLKGNTNLKSKVISLAKKKLNQGKKLVNTNIKSKVISLAKNKVNQAKVFALSKLSKNKLKSTLSKKIKPLLKRKLKPLLSPAATKNPRVQKIQRRRRGRKRSMSKRNQKKFEKGLIPDSHYWMY